MMTKAFLARASAAAIAAALAFPPIPAFAQDATTQVQPAPATTTPPVVTEPAPAAADPAPAATPPPEPATTSARAAPSRTARTASKARAAPVHAAPKPVPAHAAAAPVAVPAPATAKTAPIVDTTPAAGAPRPAPVARSAPAIDTNEALLLGGGALGLLALAGAGVAIARRRRRDERVEYDMTPETSESVIEPAASPEPKPVTEPQPPILAPPISAFSWGRPAAKTSAPKRTESWVERAYRGPTPENPSLSLRKRLKRAAFFDKREREAAAGIAPEVEPDAGLPDNINTREFEAA